MTGFWFESAPLWLVWVAMTLVLVIAQDLGFRGRRAMRVRARTRAEDEPDDPGVGYVVSATLALLGLLIAFTFSMAAERYDARRLLVLDEANAVGTAYLRIQLLDEPARTTLSGNMVAYVDARRAFFGAGRDAAKLDAARRQTASAETALWKGLVSALKAQPGTTTHPSLLEAANAMFDLAASDEAALSSRLPGSILNVLLLYSVIAAALIGYGGGASDRRHFVANAVLSALFALAICLIIDLDRPRRGSIMVSDTPFERAAADIRAMEAGR